MVKAIEFFCRPDCFDRDVHSVERNVFLLCEVLQQMCGAGGDTRKKCLYRNDLLIGPRRTINDEVMHSRRIQRPAMDMCGRRVNPIYQPIDGHPHLPMMRATAVDVGRATVPLWSSCPS